MPELDQLDGVTPEQWRRFSTLHSKASDIMKQMAAALEAKEMVKYRKLVSDLASLAGNQTDGGGIAPIASA